MLLAQTGGTATTTFILSVCGNAIVDTTEDCDVIPVQSGVYSETIAGRQCTPTCDFGPYCGDGVLQTLFGEECDDGNNTDADFCSARCRIEPAGSGGGGSSGGGGGGGGGSNARFGETQVSISGRAYPGRTVNVLIDAKSVGTVQADSTGRFEFTANTSPGTASLGIWSTDNTGVRSITLNSIFDVTQGAITNVNGLVLPPTIKLSTATINPGDVVTVSGQSIPGALIELQVGNSGRNERATSSTSGVWQLQLATSGLRPAEYALRARSILGQAPLVAQSNYSSSVQLFVGVDGKTTTPSDLSRDGKINLTDFSILIFWWGSNAGNSDPTADISGNGRVGIEDFSILLFNWTG